VVGRQRGRAVVGRRRARPALADGGLIRPRSVNGNTMELIKTQNFPNFATIEIRPRGERSALINRTAEKI
jgi:hypothetical protein